MLHEAQKNHLDTVEQAIFRYDCTPHFPDIPSFPHHKHTSDAVLAAERPDIISIIMEVINHLGTMQLP
jgi:hypothetical protein